MTVCESTHHTYGNYSNNFDDCPSPPNSEYQFCCVSCILAATCKHKCSLMDNPACRNMMDFKVA